MKYKHKNRVFSFTTGVLMAIVLWAGAAQAANHEVTQSAKAFSTETLTVKAGDTVTFVNKDDVAHNIYSKDANAFEIQKQEPGQKESVPFKTAGETKVRCAIHPKMKMTIKVE